MLENIRAYDPRHILVSRFTRSVVAVRGKCKLIRLLSRAVFMHPRWSALQLILSRHIRVRGYTTSDLAFVL